MPSIIEIRQLEKHYPGVQAVAGVSFTITAGQCFGLLGPNGAGKTTTLEMLEGIIAPDTGDILYKGAPRDRRFKEEIGIQFQSTSLQDFLTARECLHLFASLYPAHTDLAVLIEQCELSAFLDRDTRKLSGGQRQRLLLAIALVNDPDLVFLDEPTTGLDPQSRRNFWRLIEGIRAAGKTVLLTTHYMEEAQRLCDEIAIMDHGRIVERGTPVALLSEHFPSSIVRLQGVAASDIAAIPGAQRAASGEIEIPTDDVAGTLELLTRSGLPLGDLRIDAPTLEDLFLKLTGHGLRG